ncbi:MAG: hypothetical protein JNK87_27255 [Bryobacterales bacterium]|nr:hypothetical protein [Bryobacterales bacterium]
MLAVVADKSIEEVLKCLLKRYQAFGTAPLLQDFRVFRIPKMTDGAILKRSHLYLIDARRNETAAMVICDRHGSGAGGSREELEARIEANIRQSGAFSECCAIVIDPELENWIWTKSPRLDQAIGWNRQPKLRHWLVQEGLLEVDAVKPANPKLALERALQHA